MHTTAMWTVAAVATDFSAKAYTEPYMPALKDMQPYSERMDALVEVGVNLDTYFRLNRERNPDLSFEDVQERVTNVLLDNWHTHGKIECDEEDILGCIDEAEADEQEKCEAAERTAEWLREYKGIHTKRISANDMSVDVYRGTATGGDHGSTT